MTNPYEILGVSRNASDSEVRQARKKLLFDLHSDRLPKDLPQGAAEVIRKRVLEINGAYEAIQKEREENYAKNKQTYGNTRDTTGSVNEGSKDVSKAKPSNSQGKAAPRKSQGLKKESKVPGEWIVQVLGALISVSLLHMCRDARNNQRVYETNNNKIEEIVTSSADYCPELKSSIEQGKDQGDDMALKMLSEMRKGAPEGSMYQTEVKQVIEKLRSATGADTETTKEEMKSIFTKYLPLVCNGDLYAAKNQIEEKTNSNEQESIQGKAMDIFANAMCNAMRNNEDMSTVDSRRSVGATYIGRELDMLPEEKREQVRLELAQSTNDKEWMKKSMLRFIRSCPDVSYRMMEG